MAVELKLVIDREKGRVACAESDKHFAETIFSFLTTTVGTVVRLSSKKSNLGCMDALYGSVENLDSQYWQTPAVREMLLRPRSALELRSKDLDLSIDMEWPTYYTCVSQSSVSCQPYYSCVSNAQCASCGGNMSRCMYFNRSTKEGVFLTGGMRFMIADDLSVDHVSATTTCLSRISKLGVSNLTDLDVKSVTASACEAFNLLKRSLVSKTPLTDVFLTKVGASDKDAVNISPTSEDAATEGKESSKKMRVKLMLSKSQKKLLYAEANADFVDLLFSFLTFPLGSIVKLLGPGSSIHCLDNLYKSVEDLSNNDSCIISEKCRAMLLDPELALHWQTANQLLPVAEQAPKWNSINPKIKGGTSKIGGGFVDGQKSTFIVTDGLVVKPMSFVLGISLLQGFNVPFSDLQEHVVSVGEKEVADGSCADVITASSTWSSSFPDECITAALSLLRVSLSSETVLTDVFCRSKHQQSETELECNDPHRY